MLFFFNLLFLTFSNNRNIKFAYLFVDDTHSSQYNESDDYIKLCKEELKPICNYYSGKEKDQCNALFKSFLGVYVSDTTSIDKKIKQIQKETDFLFIISKSIGLTYNFNNFESKIAVDLDSYYYENSLSYSLMNRIQKTITETIHNMIKIQFDGSPSSFIQLKLSHKNQRDPNNIPIKKRQTPQNSDRKYSISLIYQATSLLITKHYFDGTNEKLIIPYEMTKSFFLDTKAISMYIGVHDTSQPSYSPVNIDVSDSEMKEDHNLVSVKASDEWKRVAEKPKISLTVDNRRYEINLSKPDQSFDVEVRRRHKDPHEKGNGSKKSTIIGVVVGCVIGIAIIVILVCYCCKKRRSGVENRDSSKSNQKAEQQQQQPNYNHQQQQNYYQPQPQYPQQPPYTKQHPPYPQQNQYPQQPHYPQQPPYTLQPPLYPQQNQYPQQTQYPQQQDQYPQQNDPNNPYASPIGYPNQQYYQTYPSQPYSYPNQAYQGQGYPDQSDQGQAIPIQPYDSNNLQGKDNESSDQSD